MRDCIGNNVGDYRFGFNGKENEIKGDGNQQDYGMRIYEPRLGKFLSVDPIAKNYPWYTPYQFAGNMPIIAIDIDGEEPAVKNMEARDVFIPHRYATITTADVYRNAVISFFMNHDKKDYEPVGEAETKVAFFFSHQVIPPQMSETSEATMDRIRLYNDVVTSLFSTNQSSINSAIKTINTPSRFFYQNAVAVYIPPAAIERLTLATLAKILSKSDSPALISTIPLAKSVKSY